MKLVVEQFFLLGDLFGLRVEHMLLFFDQLVLLVKAVFQIVELALHIAPGWRSAFTLSGAVVLSDTFRLRVAIILRDMFFLSAIPALRCTFILCRAVILSDTFWLSTATILHGAISLSDVFRLRVAVVLCGAIVLCDMLFLCSISVLCRAIILCNILALRVDIGLYIVGAGGQGDKSRQRKKEKSSRS